MRKSSSLSFVNLMPLIQKGDWILSPATTRLVLCGAPKVLPETANAVKDTIMRTTAPVDGWSAYYALLTDALSALPAREPRKPAKPRRSLAERLDHWFTDQRIRERERYLAQASDLADLERRMRQLDRYY